MSIRAFKAWQTICDTDGCSNWNQLREGDRSQWTDERIFNRGQLAAHLRTAGWTVGKQVLCPHCARSRR